jgi:hypothetical protein
MTIRELVEELNQFIERDEDKVRITQQPPTADLITEAEAAGERLTYFVHDQLALAFASWVTQRHPGEITEDEKDALLRAFAKGCGLCVHD